MCIIYSRHCGMLVQRTELIEVGEVLVEYMSCVSSHIHSLGNLPRHRKSERGGD